MHGKRAVVHEFGTVQYPVHVLTIVIASALCNYRIKICCRKKQYEMQILVALLCFYQENRGLSTNI